MKKIQTSKLILAVDIAVAILLAVIVTAGMFLDKDASSVAIVAGFWDAQLAVAVGAYYWKAKNENRSKHAMKLVEKLAGQYGIENVVSLAEIILKD